MQPSIAKYFPPIIFLGNMKIQDKFPQLSVNIVNQLRQFQSVSRNFSLGQLFIEYHDKSLIIIHFTSIRLNKEMHPFE